MRTNAVIIKTLMKKLDFLSLFAAPTCHLSIKKLLFHTFNVSLCFHCSLVQKLQAIKFHQRLVNNCANFEKGLSLIQV